MPKTKGFRKIAQVEGESSYLKARWDSLSLYNLEKSMEPLYRIQSNDNNHSNMLRLPLSFYNLDMINYWFDHFTLEEKIGKKNGGLDKKANNQWLCCTDTIQDMHTNLC